MGQKKLQRFAEIETFPNVLIYPQGMPGKWAQHFGNDQSLTLELACGKGDYTLALARRFPQRNFMGVDVKGNRIWRGAKTALNEKLGNVAFLRTQIDKLNEYFLPGEVEQIWITFPDPFLRKSRARHRLTHPRFLALYQQVLPKGATINLKTDSPQLYKFTKMVIEATGCTLLEDIPNVYDPAAAVDPLLRDIQTYYEGMHLADGRTIRFLKFVLPEQLIDWKTVKLDLEDEEDTGGER